MCGYQIPTITPLVICLGLLGHVPSVGCQGSVTWCSEPKAAATPQRELVRHGLKFHCWPEEKHGFVWKTQWSIIVFPIHTSFPDTPPSSNFVEFRGENTPAICEVVLDRWHEIARSSCATFTRSCCLHPSARVVERPRKAQFRTPRGLCKTRGQNAKPRGLWDNGLWWFLN
jgi:hypothetical protein